MWSRPPAGFKGMPGMEQRDNSNNQQGNNTTTNGDAVTINVNNDATTTPKNNNSKDINELQDVDLDIETPTPLEKFDELQQNSTVQEYHISISIDNKKMK